MEYLFLIDGDIFGVLAKKLTLRLFIRQISLHGKFTALHKLISIVLRLMNQIK